MAIPTIPQRIDDRLARAEAALEHVPDPEIPVISIIDLGILRAVRIAPDNPAIIEVVITPTYSGCPAMSQIAADIGAALDAANLTPYRVRTELSPAWTTDWILPAAREKLRAYGIAPPVGSADLVSPQPVRFIKKGMQSPLASATPACPQCGSTNTELLSQFGSTACKALYRCVACREAFDYFKPY